MFEEEKLDERARDFMKAEDTDKALLDEIRRENAELGRTPEGAASRSMTVMIACCTIAWAVMTLFDFVNGHGVAAPTVVMLGAFAGLCWGNYRESHERAIGFYALGAGAVAIVLAVLHFMGVA